MEQPFHSSPFHAAGEVWGSLSFPEPDFGNCSLNHCLEKQTQGSNPSSHSQGIQPILSGRCWPRFQLGGIIPTRKMNILRGLLLIVSHPKPFSKTFKGTAGKSWLPGGNVYGFNEFPGSPHGWLFMGWFHEGLANGYGEMALEQSGIPVVLGAVWGWDIGLFPSQKIGGEGKYREKVAGLWCHSCGIRKGNNFVAKIPQKTGHL